MGRGATKAAGNVWYEARMEAAKWNDKLLSRAGAAEALNIQDMFILCYEVIKVNFSGFFKKLGVQFGRQLRAMAKEKEKSSDTESST